ncbi:YnfA family protein [Sporolactobacillus sp. THM7-4]|nr:YnfA family protein [Sporolactobacillus sp. THM7-4]
MVKAMILFIMAGCAEIGGGYLIWQWLRAGSSGWLGLIGGLLLFSYGIIAAWQVFPSFGRVYAAYGGIFIVMSLLWGWWIDRKNPDINDLIGGLICLIGATVIIWPRG